MSQRDLYSLDRTHLPDDQSQDIPPAVATPKSRNFSLAGHAYVSFSPKIRTDSFVTAEYEHLNPDYNQPETLPIWGLAKPFPRIVRSGMRTRNDSSASKNYVVDDDVRTPNQRSQSTPPSNMISNSFDHSEIRPGVVSAPNWADKHHSDVLQAPTAPVNADMIPSGSATAQNLRPEPIREESRTRQEADPQLSDPVTESSRNPYQSGETINELHDKPTYTPPFRDVAAHTKGYSEQDHGHTQITRHESLISNDKSIVDAARQRIQQHTNNTATDPIRQKPAVREDWEELYPPDDRKPSSVSNPTQLKTIEQPQRRFHNKWARFRHKLRQPLAEFLGIFVLCLIGLSASMVHATSQDQAGNFLTSDLCWGLGVMIGIYVAGGISGGHINPAISIMLSAFRGFPWKQCAVYVLAQFLGAFTAAGVVYGLFRNAIMHTDGRHLQSTSGIAFYTQPQEWVSNVTAFFVEFVAAALLAGVILAMGDDNNAPPGAGMQAFIIGLLVFALCMSFGYITGAALNPARDFSPRLVTLFAGYGRDVFTVRKCWWLWGCWIAPITGALIGAFVYDFFIFTGAESPVNYPFSYWKMRTGAVKGQAARGTRDKGKGKEKDEEKAEDNVA